ncbi:MAG TPA: ACT domain-containing protein, partial [Marinagarivorans sp.]
MQLILSVISDDKPGVVRAVANAVAHSKGNWLDCQMSRLGGKFAGVICVDIDEPHKQALEGAVQALAQQGIRVVVDTVASQAVDEGARASFKSSAPDRPGLVLEMSQALADRGINLLELATECTSMPYSGDPLFCAEGVMVL